MADDSPTTPRVNATRRCSELLRKIMVSQSIVTSALQIPEMSGVFQERVFRDHVTGRTGMREFIGQFIKPYDPEKDFPKIAELLAKQTAVNGEMVISGAVVVLSHSTADEIFTATCDMAAELDPIGWISELNMARTITLQVLREEGPDRIFQNEVEKFRKQLADKSLPKRADLLFRHVKIVHNRIFKPTDPQYFTARTLEKADDLRHKIVHENALPQTNLRESTEMMLFLHEAAATAVRSVSFAYNIPLDPKILLGVPIPSGNAAFYGET